MSNNRVTKNLNYAQLRKGRNLSEIPSSEKYNSKVAPEDNRKQNNSSEDEENDNHNGKDDGLKNILASNISNNNGNSKFYSKIFSGALNKDNLDYINSLLKKSDKKQQQQQQLDYLNNSFKGSPQQNSKKTKAVNNSFDLILDNKEGIRQSSSTGGGSVNNSFNLASGEGSQQAERTQSQLSKSQKRGIGNTGGTSNRGSVPVPLKEKVIDEMKDSHFLDQNLKGDNSNAGKDANFSSKLGDQKGHLSKQDIKDENMTSKETQCSTCSGINSSLQKGKNESDNFLKCVDESLSYFEKTERDSEKFANKLKNKKNQGESSYRQTSPPKDNPSMSTNNIGKTEMKLMKQQLEKYESRMLESQSIQRNMMNELALYKQREEESKKLIKYQEQELRELRQKLNNYKFKLKYVHEALAKERIENENNKIALKRVLVNNMNENKFESKLRQVMKRGKILEKNNLSGKEFEKKIQIMGGHQKEHDHDENSYEEPNEDSAKSLFSNEGEGFHEEQIIYNMNQKSAAGKPKGKDTQNYDLKKKRKSLGVSEEFDEEDQQDYLNYKMYKFSKSQRQIHDDPNLKNPKIKKDTPSFYLNENYEDNYDGSGGEIQNASLSFHNSD